MWVCFNSLQTGSFSSNKRHRSCGIKVISYGSVGSSGLKVWSLVIYGKSSSLGPRFLYLYSTVIWLNSPCLCWAWTFSVYFFYFQSSAYSHPFHARWQNALIVHGRLKLIHETKEQKAKSKMGHKWSQEHEEWKWMEASGFFSIPVACRV